MVVHVGRERLKVLTQNGSTQTVSVQELRGKRNMKSQRSSALDSRHVSIHVGDVVRVVSGPHAGQSGRIKHMHRAYLFLHSPQIAGNAGICVVRCRHVVLAGTKARRSGDALGVAGNVNMRSGKKKRTRDPLVGLTVLIKKGRWAGRQGMVMDVQGSTPLCV